MLLPGCIWLGYVAYRCGSILPGVVLHMLTNGGVQVLARFSPDDPAAAESEPVRWICALVAVATGAACAWLLVLVHRWTRVPAKPAQETPFEALPAEGGAAV